MQTTKDLVQAIHRGDSTEIQASFDAIMNNKLHTAIEAYRDAVVEGVFAPVEAEETVDSTEMETEQE